MLFLLIALVFNIYLISIFITILELFAESPMFIKTKWQFLFSIFVPGYLFYLILERARAFNKARNNIKTWFK